MPAFYAPIILNEQAAPITPSTGQVAVYAKSDGKVYIKDDAGTETDLTATGGGGSGAVSCQAIFDGLGNVIEAGSKARITAPYSMTIIGWSIFSDVSGSAVVDVYKDTYANYPPTAGDSIAGTEKPTLSSAIKNQDLTLTTWTTSVNAGDVLIFNVDSASAVNYLTVVLEGTRT